MKKKINLIVVLPIFFLLASLSPSLVFAELTTQSNTVTTRVGNPAADKVTPVGESGAKIASKAIEISQQLKNSSPPLPGCAVTKFGYPPSFHCWTPEKLIYYNQVANDTDYLQCTEFIWAVFEEAGFRTQIDLIRNADAAGWPEKAVNSGGVFSVFHDATKLEPGDIISIGKRGVISDTSHVAIVTYKAPDLSYVTVAQAATDKAYDEKWPMKNGKIDSTQFPLAGRETRQEVKGFIRLAK